MGKQKPKIGKWISLENGLSGYISEMYIKDGHLIIVAKDRWGREFYFDRAEYKRAIKR